MVAMWKTDLRIELSEEELLEKIDRETPQTVTLIHLVCDNLSVHHGKLVRAWLAPRGGGAGDGGR